MMVDCPFLKTRDNDSNIVVGDCGLERCALWNCENNECWVVTGARSLSDKNKIYIFTKSSVMSRGPLLIMGKGFSSE